MIGTFQDNESVKGEEKMAPVHPGEILSERSINPYVKRVRPLADFRLEIVFENGERRIFDMKPYLRRGVFIRLQNRAIFQAVRVVAGSVEWPGELDLSYDTLYLESQPTITPAVAEMVPA